MVIPLPNTALITIIRELEHALHAAKSGTLTSCTIGYSTRDGEFYSCSEAEDFHAALLLLGQSTMLRNDIISMVKQFRDASTNENANAASCTASFGPHPKP
jgi:hypothetical protein